MDSITVVCEKIERRDQPLRDAARGTSTAKLIRILPILNPSPAESFSKYRIKDILNKVRIFRMYKI